MKAKTSRKVEVLAPIIKESASLAKVNTALALPPEEERQADLQYLNAIFVSSGMNKNGAVFLGSELLKAEDTIVGKAVDIEHIEQDVIGQITARCYMDKEGSLLDINEVSNKEESSLDMMDIDIAISAVIHKARFPEICEEIDAGEWMVSMEAYYRDYDIKVGELIIPREQAENLGYDKLVGSVVRVREGSKELGFHLVGRVLRDIHFAGVGIVKNPANPRSIIMESAAVKDYEKEHAGELEAVIDLSDLKKEESSEKDAKVTAPAAKTPEVDVASRSDNPGTCVNFKRYLVEWKTKDQDSMEDPPTDLSQYPQDIRIAKDVLEPGDQIVGEYHCNLFDAPCTARPGDATHPECLRNQLARAAREEVYSYEESKRMEKLNATFVSVKELVEKAKKFKK